MHLALHPASAQSPSHSVVVVDGRIVVVVGRLRVVVVVALQQQYDGWQPTSPSGARTSLPAQRWPLLQYQKS